MAHLKLLTGTIKNDVECNNPKCITKTSIISPTASRYRAIYANVNIVTRHC